jgi:hypothetical protein
MKVHQLDFEIFSANERLKDVMPPQRMPTYWKHDTLDREVRAGGVYLISSDHAMKSLRLSLEIAAKMATSKEPVVPTHGVNPFTGVDESAEYTAWCERNAENTPVLYINTIATRYEMDCELTKLLPEMTKWIWLDRRKGKQYPYDDMKLHMINAPIGTIMKPESKRSIFEFVEEHNVRVIVINSFEWACRTQRERDDLAAMIKTLRETYEVAFVICTTETEKKLKSGSCVRGPMGLLTMLAYWIETVNTLNPSIEARPFEPMGSDVPVDVKPQPEIMTAAEVNEHLSQLPESILLPQPDPLARSVCVNERGDFTDQRFEIMRNSDTGFVKK